ncbi:DUF2716 domain-containing protein [Rummeliibacillus sp. BSL5]
MKNWVPLLEKEMGQIWDRIYNDFEFEPSTSIFPSFNVPHPYITYNVSGYFGDSSDLSAYDDLEEKVLDVFKECTILGEYILALDWQHECYWINPRLEFERDEFGEWVIPIFPNGDYYFFIQKDFMWGILGHPWENSITIFGKELIDAFNKNKPRMFCKILRQG